MGKPVSPPSAPKTTYAIAALDSQKVEGNDGLTAYTFTVTRSGDTKKSGSLSYSTSGAQAEDFAGSLSGTITFAAGQTSKTITVWVVGDKFVEADESFVVDLSNAVGGSITTASASGTIRNDDAPPPPANLKLDVSSTAGWYDADDDGRADAGESVWHTYGVSNTGDVALSGIALTDAGVQVLGPAEGDTNNDGLLSVGETWLFHAKRDLTQAEIDAGLVHSDATATAIAPAGQLVSDSQQLDTPIPQTPEISLYTFGSWVDGSGAGTMNGIVDLGELLHFTFGVHNLGNTTLRDISLSGGVVDESTLVLLESGDGDDLLEVGETWIYSGDYAVTQTDLDARGLTTFVSVLGVAPNGDLVSADHTRDISLPWV